MEGVINTPILQDFSVGWKWLNCRYDLTMKVLRYDLQTVRGYRFYIDVTRVKILSLQDDSGKSYRCAFL